jgi:ATP sulfurylase
LRFGSAQHDWAGILGSIMNLAPPRESLVHKSVRKLIGTPLARLVAGVEAHAGQGGTFELYARKPAT